MAGPLLPFAYDQSRENENCPPLDLSQGREKKRSLDGKSRNDRCNLSDEYENGDRNNDEVCERRQLFKTFTNSSRKGHTGGFAYAALNSSSSVLHDIDHHNLNHTEHFNTSSTVINFTGDQHLSSDSMNPLNSDNYDVPSSPIMESQHDVLNRPDPLRSDAFDDLLPLGSNEVVLKPAVPSSPTLLPLSQQSTNPVKPESVFQRPKINKYIHPLSRHGSTFTEPTRKKQRMIFQEDELLQPRRESPTPPLQAAPKVEYAIDRDGHVYGYYLEKDELPVNYSPTLYDDPNYFVVKNTSRQETNLTKTLDEFFEQKVNSKNPTCILNLQYFGLTSLPDNICDVENFYDCTVDGILKPKIHIDASYNSLRSINPRLLTIERLEMLSLRNNKIARLSGNIEKATHLKSLNLGMNKFKFLPHNILSLENLEVLAITGNPMISQTSVDKYYSVNEELLRLYSKEFDSTEFLCTDKQIKYFSRIHWLKSNKHISKNAVHASILSRSLSTIQDLCYDDNGDLKDWYDFDSNGKANLRKETQSFIENQSSWCPKLSELSLRQISRYLISESEVKRWKESTSEFIYKRAMNSLIYGTNGETCGNCNENCVESVADILEWWDFKGSRSVTIKRRFCSKHCANLWREKLNKFKMDE